MDNGKETTNTSKDEITPEPTRSQLKEKIDWQRGIHKEVLKLKTEDLALYAHRGDQEETDERNLLYKGLLQHRLNMEHVKVARIGNVLLLIYTLATFLLALAAFLQLQRPQIPPAFNPTVVVQPSASTNSALVKASSALFDSKFAGQRNAKVKQRTVVIFVVNP